MSTYRQFVISSKIVSTIVHLQWGDICMAENKVWLLFWGLNILGYPGLKVWQGAFSKGLQIFLCLYLQKPVPGLPKKGFYLSQQTFPHCVSDPRHWNCFSQDGHTAGSCWAHCWPVPPDPFLQGCSFFSLNVTIHMENKCFEYQHFK